MGNDDHYKYGLQTEKDREIKHKKALPNMGQVDEGLIQDLQAAVDNGSKNKGLDNYMIKAIKKAIKILSGE